MNINPTTVNEEFVDLDLSATKKKKIRFDHDNDRVVELNTSDMGFIGRVSEVLPKLQELQSRAGKLLDGVSDDAESIEGYRTVGERLATIDAEMREYVDQLFNAPVCEKAAPDGSMYDPFNGMYRFEYIISVLVDQYEDNLKAEYEKIQARTKKHTAKYVK